MFIFSKVCAEFRDKKGNVIFSIGQDNFQKYIEAPEAIREDPLFQMLVEDGSLSAPRTPEELKKLEKDPLEGTDASGKRKMAKAGTSAEKADASAEENAEKNGKTSSNIK